MAIVNVNIDDDIYAHALEMFSFRGKTVEQAVRELFEHAAYDEELKYEHIPLNEETVKAIEQAEQGIGLVGPFSNMDDFWAAMEQEDDDNA